MSDIEKKDRTDASVTYEHLKGVVGTPPKSDWPFDNENFERRPRIELKKVLLDGYNRVSPLIGLNYLEFLKILHIRRGASRYLEIGTQHGASLRFALGMAIAIDPNFLLDKDVWNNKTGIKLFETTSDAYFADKNPQEALGGPIDLAFIDGMHLSEYVLRDFINVEHFCSPSGVIVLHDSIPQNFEMTERDRRPSLRIDQTLAGAWTGDVWRMIPLLQEFRPDLQLTVLDCPPTGLVLISNLSPNDEVLASHRDEVTESLLNEDVSESEFWSFATDLQVFDSKSLI